MNEKINLKEIEKKSWLTYFEDGFWDIFFGLMMLTIGFRTLTDNAGFTLMMFLPVLIIILGKKFVTTPRLGLVKFGTTRKTKQKKLMVVLIISLLVTFVVLLLPYLGLALPEIWISPIMAIGIALIFGLLAYYMDFARLFAYGVLFAISEMLWGLFDKPIGPIANTVSGIIILLIGLVLLSRFLRKYPLLKEEMLNENSG